MGMYWQQDHVRIFARLLTLYTILTNTSKYACLRIMAFVYRYLSAGTYGNGMRFIPAARPFLELPMRKAAPLYLTQFFVLIGSTYLALRYLVYPVIMRVIWRILWADSILTHIISDILIAMPLLDFTNYCVNTLEAYRRQDIFPFIKPFHIFTLIGHLIQYIYNYVTGKVKSGSQWTWIKIKLISSIVWEKLK